MEANRNIHATNQPIDYSAPANPPIPFDKLIELYAAAIYQGLRPAPMRLSTIIMNRLTQTPPTIAELQCLYKHVPWNHGCPKFREPLYTRLATSFHKNHEAGKYAPEQYTAIKTFVSGEVRKAFLGLTNSIHDARVRGAHQAAARQDREETRAKSEEDLAAFVGSSVKNLRAGSSIGGAASVASDAAEVNFSVGSGALRASLQRSARVSDSGASRVVQRTLDRVWELVPGRSLSRRRLGVRSRLPGAANATVATSRPSVRRGVMARSGKGFFGTVVTTRLLSLRTVVSVVSFVVSWGFGTTRRRHRGLYLGLGGYCYQLCFPKVLLSRVFAGAILADGNRGGEGWVQGL